MRICIVLHSDLFYPWPILRAMREIEVLRKKHAKIFVLSWIKKSLPLPETENRNGLNIIRIFQRPAKSGFFRALGYRKLLLRAAEKIISLRPEAIVCHDLEMLPAAVRAKKKLDVPLLYHAHEDWPQMVREDGKILESKIFEFIERHALKYVDHVYTVGEELAEKFRKHGCEVTVQYGSKPLASMPTRETKTVVELKRKLGFNEKDFIIGYGGAVGGAEALEQVFYALAKDVPEEIRLLIAGGEEQKLIPLHSKAKRIGIEDKIRFTGRLSPEELLNHIATFDVGLALFLPLSLNQLNRTPIKIFDYMGVGIPIIISNFPAMQRIVIEDANCGLAVDPKNPNEIRRAIMKLYRDRELMKKLGLNGKKKFAEKYCWEKQEEVLKRSHFVWRF